MLEDPARSSSEVSSAPSEFPRLLLIIPVLMAIALIAFVFQKPSGPSQVDVGALVDVEASEPVFDNLQKLYENSDAVISGRVISQVPGRSITNPSDPTNGIRTAIFTVAVEEVFSLNSASGAATRNNESSAGQSSDSNSESMVEIPKQVKIEVEIALLDGTQISLNGVAPPAVIERRLFFLITSDDPRFPHFAIVNSQGSYLLSGQELLDVDERSPLYGIESLDDLSAALAQE